jgi:hypothetical protein
LRRRFDPPVFKKREDDLPSTYEEHDPDYVESAYKYSDEEGVYRLLPLLNPNDNRPNLTYEFLGVTRSSYSSGTIQLRLDGWSLRLGSSKVDSTPWHLGHS